ncbi:DHHA1 domain-containing protein [Methanolobus halotolerans]|uniref:Phosphoesterase n=1 Tax=Methanolobus halotolerans TaxID=2052935 RepID=A0A4E0QZI0_9EURY|nr:DHHA1 domain-containing protein [Methanolobus halotolerans]TGC09174.1 phosphoesterase [Methanolobus halotolerans]
MKVKGLHNSTKSSSLILTHGDSDGVCSGAIAKSAYPGSDVYFTSPVGILDELELADGYSNIIICDIAVDERACKKLYKRLTELSEASSVTYIDHHPLPGKCWDVDWLHHDVNICAAELTYKVFEKQLNRDIRRVAIYGAIGDYHDNTPSVREWLLDWDKRSLFYQAGTLIQALIYMGRNYNFKRKLLAPLSHDVIPSEIPDIPQLAKEGSHLEEMLRLRVKKQVESLDNLAYVIDPKGYMSKSAIFAASYGRRGVGIAAEYRYKKQVYDMSLRSRNGAADLNRLLRTIAPRHGGTGGGHASAAGARIPRDSFMKFLSDLDAAIGKEERKDTSEK